jgi:ubiquinone/menaquinone biosynthesis C-methylase UbiE
MEDQLENVREAFSRQAEKYDSYEEDNDILKWMREQVHQHALSYLTPGDHILEINAGTGIDAAYFASLGYRVHATDISQGMLRQLEMKVALQKLDEKISIQMISYAELDKIAKRFDYIFSNFGGLNCIPDLNPVARNIPKLLKPGGKITLVIMPPICPWELALIGRGHFKSATRRLHRNGVLAHVEGVHFKSYYFTPKSVLEVFGSEFKKIALQGLASLSPPPYMRNFPKRYPGLYRFLTSLDARLSRFPPFNSWADHFIVTLRYVPKNGN